MIMLFLSLNEGHVHSCVQNWTIKTVRNSFMTKHLCILLLAKITWMIFTKIIIANIIVHVKVEMLRNRCQPFLEE